MTDANLAEEQLMIQIEVPILQHRSLRFRRSHLVDLQAALRVLAKPAVSTLVAWPADVPKVIQVQEPATVAEIAALLGLKPFQVIAELMKFDVFKSIHDELSRQQIEKLVSKQGFAACFVRASNSR